MRQQAPQALQAILNAYPIQTAGGIDYGTAANPDLAEFIQAYSQPSQIDSASLRLDRVVLPRWKLFARAAYTTSSASARGLSDVTSSTSGQQAYSLGSDLEVTSHLYNQTRVGFARSLFKSANTLDNFGNATPINLNSAFGASGPAASSANSLIFPIGSANISSNSTANYENQWSITDTVAWTLGSHTFKLGGDYRQIHSSYQPANPTAIADYFSAVSVLGNTATIAATQQLLSASPVFNQFALFVQDEWHVSSRLNLSLDLRWEVSPAPHSTNHNVAYPIIGNSTNPSSLSLGKAGGQLYGTTLGNVVPRVGLAYQAHNTKGLETVIRGGAGLFFDTSNSTINYVFAASPGTIALNYFFGGSLPLSLSAFVFAPSNTAPYSNNTFVEPTFKQPYTVQWNAAI